MSVFRLNTEALLTDYEFSWWADASGCDFVIRCKANSLSVRGSEVTAVWDRRPERPSELPVQNTALINKHNLDEAFGFLYFIRYYLKDVPSIGSIANDRPASSKMLQLRYALEVGFKVPETCFSNTKGQIVAHLTDNGNYVLKPIESDNLWDEAADSQSGTRPPIHSGCFLPPGPPRRIFGKLPTRPTRRQLPSSRSMSTRPSSSV